MVASFIRFRHWRCLWFRLFRGRENTGFVPYFAQLASPACAMHLAAFSLRRARSAVVTYSISSRQRRGAKADFALIQYTRYGQEENRQASINLKLFHFAIHGKVFRPKCRPPRRSPHTYIASFKRAALRRHDAQKMMAWPPVFLHELR